MLKFFRRIRQQLLNEGRSRKYFVYATGEIFLVVIGILIALQINNWNEDRKERIKEKAVLEQLKEEYQNNLQQLGDKVSMRNLLMQNSFKILALIDNPGRITLDSIISLFSPLGIVPTFDPINNDLITSGNLRLIQDEKLRALLSMWTSEVIQVQEEEQHWAQVRNEIFFPFIIDQGLARDLMNEYFEKNTSGIFLPKHSSEIRMIIGDNNSASNTTEITDHHAPETVNEMKMTIGYSKNKPNLQQILDNQELEGILSMIITINEVTNLQSKVLRSRIIDILDLIDKNLQ